MGVARMARRHHASKMSMPRRHCLDDVLRAPHAHELAWLAARHLRSSPSSTWSRSVSPPHREASPRRDPQNRLFGERPTTPDASADRCRPGTMPNRVPGGSVRVILMKIAHCQRIYNSSGATCGTFGGRIRACIRRRLIATSEASVAEFAWIPPARGKFRTVAASGRAEMRASSEISASSPSSQT